MGTLTRVCSLLIYLFKAFSVRVMTSHTRKKRNFVSLFLVYYSSIIIKDYKWKTWFAWKWTAQGVNTHENHEFRFLASEKQHPLYFGQIRSLVSCPQSISQWSRFSFYDLQFGPPQKTHELIGLLCHTSCAGFPNCGF